MSNKFLVLYLFVLSSCLFYLGQIFIFMIGDLLLVSSYDKVLSLAWFLDNPRWFVKAALVNEVFTRIKCHLL